MMIYHCGGLSISTLSFLLSVLSTSCPSARSNSFSFAGNNTTSSNDLFFLLFPNHDLFEEGEIIESKPSGFFLEQLHGQLVLHQDAPLSDGSSIIWETQQAYVDDGSRIGSVAIFHDDCNFRIYSETVLRQENRFSTDSQLWYLPVSFDYDPTLHFDCFLAWNISSESLVVHLGTVASPGEEIGSMKRSIRNETSADDIVFLVPSDFYLQQGFMIESQPPSLFLRHYEGMVYLYRGRPDLPNYDLLWKTEYAYTYEGDLIFTYSHFIDDGNFVIFGRNPKDPWGLGGLWSSASSRPCEGSCYYFLAWIESEERLAIFLSNERYVPIEEIWTSRGFRWEPMNPGVQPWGQITVSVLTRFTATCSMICSGLIVGIILSRWIKNRKVYSTRDRLLFGMSLLDLLASAANIFDVTAIPADTYGILGAIGTQATCTAQGFFVQLGFGVPFYNCMLCLYTLCVVRLKWNNDFIATRVEPFMHIIAFGYSLASATLGVVLDLYNSNGSFCWVEMYPHDCAFEGHVKCLRGENAAFYQWIFAGVILISSFSIITVSMSIVYCYIRKNVKMMKARYGESSISDKQLQEVGKQAFLYVTAFMITFIWPMLVSIERQIGIGPPIWQNVLFSFFFTFQGFWNFIIFIRPVYQQLRRGNKEKSCFWVLRAAIRKEATTMRRITKYNRGSSHRGRDSMASSSRMDMPPSSMLSFKAQKSSLLQPSLAMNE